MYCPNYTNDILSTVITIAQKNISDIISQLAINEKPILYERGQDLSELAQRQKCLFLLHRGQLELRTRDKLVLIYESGDLVGIESLSPIITSVKSNDFAIEAIPIPLSYIEKDLGVNALIEIVANFSAIFFEAFSTNLPVQQELQPQIERFEDSAIIVEQGAYADDIYTLIEGQAEAYVDGKKVGDIKTDEVFGALAAMTNIGRTATIKSVGKSLVLRIKKDQLIELIKIRPGTIEKVIGDLARVIQDLNKRLCQ